VRMLWILAVLALLPAAGHAAPVAGVTVTYGVQPKPPATPKSEPKAPNKGATVALPQGYRGAVLYRPGQSLTPSGSKSAMKRAGYSWGASPR
jgi:hypothetical protein